MLRIASVSALANRKCVRGVLSLAGLTLLASTSLLLSGCGIGPIALPSAIQGTGAIMQGKVHGGQQPVSGATIQLWAASQTGYPGTSGFSAPASLLTSPVSTGADGSFSISSDYTCPVGDAEVYITATGGNPGGGTNANLVMMAALGSCDNLLANASTTFIFMDEVTTVAAAYALAQFAEPNPSGTGILVGTSSTNVNGLANAMATVNNLVDLATGQAYTITPAYASNPVPYFNTSTVPQARINTLANILASCVNTNGLGGSSTNCSTLFTAARPSGGAIPGDTLQAILDIAQHPLPAAAPIALSAATSPFQPNLPAAPNDWTLALTFTGAGLGGQGTTYGITNTSMAIDAENNIWVTAYDTATSSNDPACTAQDAACSPMIAEFNNLGAPLTPATVYNSVAIPATETFGGYQPTLNGAAVSGTNTSVLEPSNSSQTIAFDPFGNAWVGGRVEISAGLSLEHYFCTGTNCSAGNFEGPTAIDASGDVWVEGLNGSLFKTIYEYNNAGTNVVTSTGGGTYGNNWYDNLSNPVFDTYPTGSSLWASDASLGDLYRVSAATGQLVHDYYTSGGKHTAIVADGSGNIYGCPVTGKLLQFNASSTSPIATNTIASGRTCNASNGGMAMDGLGHIFNSSSGIIDEFTTTGAAISPAATGYTGTSPAEGYLNLGSSGTGIDGSGNLWILSSTTGSSSGYGNVLTEFVGLAAPVLTPTSLALSYGELATRP